MLQNVYFVAEIGFDTAEKKPSKVSRKWRGIRMGVPWVTYIETVGTSTHR